MPYVERNPAPPSDPRSLKAYVHAYIEHLKARNYATQSVQYKRASLIWFLDFADIRFIQQMLGHAHLSTTEIYTHVAIYKLKSIHEATHPARLPENVAKRVKQARDQGTEQDPDPTAEDVLDALEWEDDEENEE